MAKQNTLPRESRRALDYLHGELGVVLTMAAEIAGCTPPLSELPRIASRTLDSMLIDLTRDTVRALRHFRALPASEHAGMNPALFFCLN